MTHVVVPQYCLCTVAIPNINYQLRFSILVDLLFLHQPQIGGDMKLEFYEKAIIYLYSNEM
jgi:hypothetical protein